MQRSREARLADFVGEVEAAALCDRAQVVEAIIGGLVRLVPCERVVCADGELTGTTSTDASFQAFRRGNGELWTTLVEQHPKLVHWSQTGGGAAVRLSDVISQRALRRLTIYNDFWRPFGVEYDFGVRLESAPGVATDVSCTRSRKDFSDEERDLLEALRPYLVRILQHADARRGAQALWRRFGIRQREAEVLALVARGKTNQEIATTLSLSAGTVRKHLEHIYAKLGVATRTEAATRALEADGPDSALLETRAETHELSSDPFGLTGRESQILASLASGKSNAEIASELDVSPQTVKKHLDHIYGKLGVRSRTEAAVRARRLEANLRPRK